MVHYPTAESLESAISEISEVSFLKAGGQKGVFRCKINKVEHALKVVALEDAADGSQAANSATDIAERVRREVECMTDCDSDYVVRIGPLEVREVEIDGARFVVFAEEFILGATGRELLGASGAMLTTELAMLAHDVSSGLEELWKRRRVHRDVKPDNIMRRDSTGRYVLLDMGLILDLDATSLSQGPVGTLAYFAPEQLDFRNRRQVLGLRSDFFSLGVVLYEMATGNHPFLDSSCTAFTELLARIQTASPPSPAEAGAAIPTELDNAIMRLLEKRPALRFRTVEQLHQALACIEGGQ